jgi:hypothetical protein
MITGSASRIASAVVPITLLADCAPRPRPSSESSFEETATLQGHVNGYFHSQVMPRLADCWERLDGKGTVELVHRYAKDDDGDWTPHKVEVGHSTMRAEVARAAAECMEQAVRGAPLPKEGIATAERELFLHWTWPVPFPPIEDRSPRALYLGVGGGAGSAEAGCDGRGAQAQCKNCVDVKNNPKRSAECATVCVGYETCTEHFGSGGSINGCVLGGKCASGGPFGSVGIVLF